MKMKFKDIGHYLTQIGLYLCSVDSKEFEERVQIKENIINFLMQSYLYLQSYQQLESLDSNAECQNEFKAIENEEDVYLTKKQVIEQYKPLFTEYGLTQAIYTKGLPYIKRGNKFFFNKKEIDKWIVSSQKDSSFQRIKYV